MTNGYQRGEDTGCEFAPSCLHCPYTPECIEDELRRQRGKHMRTMINQGDSPAMIAAKLGINLADVKWAKAKHHKRSPEATVA